MMNMTAKAPLLVRAGYFTEGVVEMFKLFGNLHDFITQVLEHHAAPSRPLTPIRMAAGRPVADEQRDPEARRLRAEIRAIGERVHAAGGDQAMRDAWNEVDQRHGGRAASIVEHAWDGIGGWRA